ncbi:MAG TPA: flagellar hook-basal body complex protein FliE [Ilumatobacter sp.]|nr:flagellar hook-basal body complex protein FliE [Ilumatobacter sp.]
MALPALGAIGSLGPVGIGTLGPAAAPADVAASGFGDALLKALDGVSAAHGEADQLAIRAATGDLTAVHDYTIAATEAQLLTQLTVEVRNRAVEAFNDIMRMQV